jgi:heparan-alpha-glucosaminide N-acetyltransferase
LSKKAMSKNAANFVQVSGPQLRGGRILSIDTFRALTVLVMIMVNEWHAVPGLPQWMKHMGADDDAMSFVDVVFPAFLFIVGMSIPFALQQSTAQASHIFEVQKHMLQRAFGLVVIGLFMVNAEGGYHAASMSIPIAAWALFSYAAAFLIWGSLTNGPALGMLWRYGGVAGLLALALLYRGGVDGTSGMATQWWGILGLIGWAYLIGAIVFQITRARLPLLLLCIALCVGYFIAHRTPTIVAYPWLAILFSQDGHFSHAAIVLCGCVTAIIFFDERTQAKANARFMMAFGFALTLVIVATALRPEFKISKIYATPSWALYSAASCVLIFAALYRWIDLGGRDLLPGLLRPVAANPLLAYLIPFVVGAWMQLTGWFAPTAFRIGGVGIVYGVAYAILVALLVKLIAARGVRLRI